MITIRPHKAYTKGFTVEGHAGYAEHGQDIVCASVSIVTQMIAYELNYKGFATWTQTMEKGVLSVFIDEWGYITEEEQSYVKGVTDMMLRTLKQLQRQYPDHIKIEEEM